MKRPRFTLRSLLVLTTLVAAICWWYVQPKSGTLTEGQISRITNGMTKEQLVSLLGPPLEPQDPLASDWQYLIASSSRESPKASLIIIFDEQEKVEGTQRMFYVGDLGIMLDP